MKEITPENKIQEPKPAGFGKIILYIGLTLPLFLGWIWFIIARNNIVRMAQQVDDTASGIDVQLKKRFDLITKLVSAVKGSMEFEKSTYSKITELRQSVQNKITPDQINKVNSETAGLLRSINVQLENYPNLKSSNNVLQLQEASQNIEDNIAASRRFYNTSVRGFNSFILTYPNNVPAATKHVKTYPYFEASEADRKDVKIEF